MSVYFTKEHEWIAVDGGEGTVGITHYAQGQLGDITFVELPAVGQMIGAGDSVSVVDSVKAASDVYSPISGVVVRVNQTLSDKPETVNEDAYGEGWIFVIKPDDAAQYDELLDPDAYQDLLDQA